MLLTELPIFKHNSSYLENIATKEEATRTFQQNENDVDDIESGIGDSTPPSPTWIYDEDAGGIGIQSDHQYSTNEFLDIRFVHGEKLKHEGTDGK